MRVITALQRVTLSAYLNANGNSVTMPIGPRAIPLSDARSGVLSVRVSGGTGVTSLPAGTTATLYLVDSIITDDEPNQLYTTQPPPPTGASVASVQILDSDTWPGLYTSRFTNGAAVMGTLMLVVKPGANAGTATLTLGVEIVVRDS